MRASFTGVSRLKKQREKFDAFRTTFSGGRIELAPNFNELPDLVKGKILWRIGNYADFDKRGYHDAALLIFGDWTVAWRIEERKEGLVLDVWIVE